MNDADYGEQPFGDAAYGEIDYNHQQQEQQYYQDQQQQQHYQQQPDQFTQTSSTVPQDSSQSQHADGFYKGADFDPTKFFGSFWINDEKHDQSYGFDTLKEYQATGNTFLKEISGIFKERAAIEEQYAKSLQKLQGKALKIDNFTEGSLRDGWSRIVQEFEEQAQWHTKIADMFKIRICESVLTFEKKVKKDQKQKQMAVDKEYAKYSDAVNYKNKCLKATFSKTKDVETAEVNLGDLRDPGNKKGTPKEIARGERAVKKSAESSKNADEVFKQSLTKLQEAREDWEEEMIKGCNALEELEGQRIQLLKQVFYDVSSTYTSLIPDMQKSYNECTTCAQNIDTAEVVAKICENRGTGQYTCQQVLYGTYEENLKIPINQQRRVLWLTKRLNAWKGIIQQHHMTRAGFLKLLDASLGVQNERNSSMKAVNEVKRKLISFEYTLAAAHATAGKFRCAIAECKSQPPPQFELSQYIHSYSDKNFVSHYMLRLPKDYVVDAQKLLEDEQRMAANDDQYGGNVIEIVSTPSVAMNEPNAQNGRPQMPMPPSQPPQFHSQANAQDGSDDDDDDDDFSSDDEEDVRKQSYHQPSQEMHAPPPAQQSNIPPPPPMPSQSAPPVMQLHQEPQCRALYDYVATEADELTISAGEILTLLDSSDDDWWTTRNANGQQGVVPQTYVELL
eukprot:m.92800 g.92800  ORF g.92800 m.92800 type:complete len:676 (+) comp8901_c0_seq3:109-2136(+)